MLKKLILLFLCLDFLCLTGVYLARSYGRANPPRSNGQEVVIKLRRGPLTVFDFAPRQIRPRAVIIFGSGDGGWGGWEETVSETLRKNGYQVIGIDSADYARTDYDLTTLQEDFRKIADKFLSAYGANPPPLLEGGWSMGAAQAIAIAGGAHPPRDLAGLIIASPLSRGRYGLRLTDKLNILPTGPGTFAVDDFAPAMAHLRIAQWHGTEDTIDSTAWLKALKSPHREYDLPNAGHTYNGASPLFLQQLVGSIGWILDQPPQELDARNN
jgi:alpha-beta hydrolase superfamily lysophospholipase